MSLDNLGVDMLESYLRPVWDLPSRRLRSLESNLGALKDVLQEVQAAVLLTGHKHAN